MNPYVFTRHARNRLRRVKLSQDELLRLLEQTSVRHVEGTRHNVWIAWNGGWIRVVLAEEADAIVVVSVIWPAREPRNPQA